MLIPGFDNNGVLTPGVDGFKNLVNDLTVSKVDTVKVKKVLDKLPDNKTTFNLNNDLANPLQKMVTDFGLNPVKQTNTVGKHAVENTVNNFNNPVNLSEIIQPLLKPVMDLFEISKPKADSKHHKSNHKTSKSQWVYFDRYRILPKPFNDFLNGLKVPRFYYLTLRDWTIIQALQIPVAIGIGLLLVVPTIAVVTFAAFLFALALPLIIPAVLISAIFIAAASITIIIGILVTIPVAAAVTWAFLFVWSGFWAFLIAFIVTGTAIFWWALIGALIGGFGFAAAGGAITIPIGGGGVVVGLLGLLIGGLIGAFAAFIIVGLSSFWGSAVVIYFAAILFWFPFFCIVFGLFSIFVALVISIGITIVTIPLVLIITALVALPAMALTIFGVPFILTVINIGIIIALIVGFVRSLGKPRLLTKRSLDKARRSSHHHSRSHHSEHGKSKRGESEHSKSGDSKPKKHHHKRKSTNPLDGVNNTLRDLLGTNPKPKHKKHHTSGVSTTAGPRHKVSAVKRVVVDYSQVTGVNNTGNVSNLVGLNQVNTATNISNPNLNTFGLVRVPVTLLSNVKDLLSIPNTVTPTLLKQQDTSGGDNTVCTPSGLVGITCTTVSPTVNENINSAVEEQTQVVPQTTTTTTTNTDGTTTKTTTVDKNKPPKVVPKKVWPLPTTGLMSRIDYFVLQNRATGRHNNLVNTMDTLYGTKHHPGPLRPIAEATAGLVDNI